eukprot:gene5788-7199_t
MQSSNITIGDLVYLLDESQHLKLQQQKESSCNKKQQKLTTKDNNNINELILEYNEDCLNNNNFSISIAWPSKSVQSGHIQIDSIQRENCNSTIGSNIYLYRTPYQSIVSENKRTTINPLLNADSITIICETKSNIEYTEKLASFRMLSTLLQSQLLGRYFIQENYFTVSLHGKNIKFKIISINNNYSSNNNNNNNEINQIESLLNCLDLNNNNNFKINPIFRIHEQSNFIFIKEEETKDQQQEQQEQQEIITPNSKVENNKIIGGLDEQVKQVRELIDLTFYKSKTLSEFGIKPPRGVLLYGPPGTGKTALARYISRETNATLFTINGADILDKFYGMTEKTLQSIFKDAIKKSPSIVFIDEIDTLCPKRQENSSEVEKRVVGSLLTLMDGVESNERVFVIGCTNRPDSIDEALRRPGRFDKEIEISIPNSKGREEILNIFFSRIPHQLTPQDISVVASKTHGFVGADLESLCKESTLKCFHRLKKENSNLLLESLESQQQNNNILESINVTMPDVLEAMTECKPSSMREVVVEIPKVYWNDIGGQHEIKQKMKEAIEWPLKYPQSFIRMGIKPPKGILLYGPPGCSKTLMAKALATESGLNFIAVKGPELISKWVGESERAVRDIFKKARQNSPSILFFDEMDGLAITRSGEGSGAVERVVSQLLTEMDGIQPLTNVTIIAATNRPDIIDKAILRAGRIDRILYISPPDFDSRKEIFNIHLRKVPHTDDIDLDQLSTLTDGYSGAEVTSICREASICAMKENINAEKITMSNFLNAIGQVKKGITQEMLDFYKKYQEQSNLQKL